MLSTVVQLQGTNDGGWMCDHTERFKNNFCHNCEPLALFERFSGFFFSKIFLMWIFQCPFTSSEGSSCGLRSGGVGAPGVACLSQPLPREAGSLSRRALSSLQQAWGCPLGTPVFFWKSLSDMQTCCCQHPCSFAVGKLVIFRSRM